MILDEKASIVSLPLVVTTSSYSVESSTLVVILSSSNMAVTHQTTKKLGFMGIDPGHHQCIYLLLSYHIHDMACHGGSKEHMDLSHEVGNIWDYQDYLILIIALDSIYLNPYDDVANRSSKGVSQACADDSSSYKVWERPDVQRVIFNKPWHNGVDLGTIVQECHVSLPIDSYSGYILDPIPWAKGIRIQEESLHLAFYALGVLSWSTFGVVTFPWGADNHR